MTSKVNVAELIGEDIVPIRNFSSIIGAQQANYSFINTTIPPIVINNSSGFVPTLFPEFSTFAPFLNDTPGFSQPIFPTNVPYQPTLATLNPEQPTLATFPTLNPEQSTLSQTTIAVVTGIPETFPTPAPLETPTSETGFPIPPLNVDSNRDAGPQTGKFLLDPTLFNLP